MRSRPPAHLRDDPAVTGRDPRVIMDTLGHSTIGMTLNTYAHVLPAANRAAAAQMDSALDGWRQS